MPNKKTHEEFVSDVTSLVGNEYTVIGQYVGSLNKIEIRHNKCSTIYEVIPSKFTFGHRCPECEPSKKKTHDRFVKQVDELTRGEYTVIGKYTGDAYHVDVRHNECGNIFSVKANNLLNGKGCPSCKSSKGEKKIERALVKNNISFVRQFKISECKHIKPLPFDFAILEKGEIKLLIEYQGQQHYNSIKLFGGEKGFRAVKRNDSIKKDYCIANNIKLLEISYHRFNDIESIIKEIV